MSSTVMCEVVKKKFTEEDSSQNDEYYIGVDVGSSSARAILVNSSGKVIAVASHPIQVFEYKDDFYEQSSEDIWQACCKVINSVHEGVDKTQIHGLGFDSTCSLVVLDSKFSPTTVSPSGDSQWNVVMWMDHRAKEQANKINATNHPVLRYVGGKISLEMQTPKLLWLKEEMKESCWDKAANFFDLPDFLTWRATGSLTRSLCSLVCKWTYICDRNGQQGWDKDYFETIGLSDIAENNYSKIGIDAQKPGDVCCERLTKSAAEELGLRPGTKVSTSIIDAHAGGIGSLASSHPDYQSIPIQNRLALICGTSTCHMALQKNPLFIDGVWGPYYSAMIPNMWLTEGGQSAAGKLIDHIVENHTSYSWIKDDASRRNIHPYAVLNEILEFMVKKSGTINSVAELTESYHIYPDFHGNRSPLADASIKGMGCGMSLSSGAEDLALQYLAVIQALAYSTQHIIDAMTDAGHDIKIIHACGGLSKNILYIQTHADVTGLPIILPDNEESVLLGSAILAANASGKFSSVQNAMAKMGGTGRVFIPDQSSESYHKKKYNVFLKMLEHQRLYKTIMNSDT